MKKVRQARPPVSMAREIARDLLRRGWLPSFTRGYITRPDAEPLDSVADETWTAMHEVLSGRRERPDAER